MVEIVLDRITRALIHNPKEIVGGKFTCLQFLTIPISIPFQRFVLLLKELSLLSLIISPAIVLILFLISPETESLTVLILFITFCIYPIKPFNRI